MKKIICLLMTIVICTTFFVSCTSNNNSSDKNKLTVAVAIPPVKAFAQAVCGNLADVYSVIPQGSSPENYEPTPQEKENFAKANIYFSIGVAAEQSNTLPNVSEKTKIVYLQDEVAKKYDDLTMEGGRDPHIWVSPKRAIVIVETIKNEMCAIDSENADKYTKNANRYIEELTKTDNEIKEILSQISNKKMIVFHPAFGYLADDYGIEMYALEENGKEATAKRLAEMIDFAKKENIKVIFYQAEIDSSQSKAFAEEIGGKTVMLSPLAENYIENLKSMALTMKEAMN